MSAIFTILLVLADQITKWLTIRFLASGERVALISGILSLTYVENRGAAFGILAGARWFFIAITLLVVAALVVYGIKKNPPSVLFKISAPLICAGAVGNLIDRVFRGYVVDMIEATFIDFPVFNVADCCVVIGAVLFCLYVIKE